MANRAGLFPILLLASLLFAPIVAPAAEEPVATAPIPPPVPSAPFIAPTTPATPPPVPKAPMTATPAPKAPATASPAKPPSETSAKKSASAAARKQVEHKTAAVHRLHRRSERRQLAARFSPPPRPAMQPRYYSGEPVLGPEAEGPSFPPPWYDRGRPLAAYPYPGPRGPMRPW